VVAAKKKRGFALMDPEEHRRIAAAGGKAAHEAGVAHRMTAEEASRAGKKGGQKVARDRAHMAKIGRLGGQAKRKRRKKEETA